MRKLWPGLLAIVLVTAYGLLSLTRLPAELATHWGFNGEVNGTMPKLMAILFAPGLGLVLAALLSTLPKLDPRKANFPMYEGTWWLVGNAILVFIAALNLFIIGIGLGWNVPMQRLVGIGVGVLLALIGNYLTRVRPNWFLGIRTPWTLTSERSWRETHLLGGRLMVLGGLLLVAVTLITGTMPVWAVVVGVLVPAVVSIAYSYFVWRQDTANVRHEAENH